ncbi:MAG TPA: hypothetical protein VFU07_05625 [Candidatus Lumbricidophila sp.]|nr:hypothetical protein [Candidatus Lumbricidophila sp.]
MTIKIEEHLGLLSETELAEYRAITAGRQVSSATRVRFLFPWLIWFLVVCGLLACSLTAMKASRSLGDLLGLVTLAVAVAVPFLLVSKGKAAINAAKPDLLGSFARRIDLEARAVAAKQASVENRGSSYQAPSWHVAGYDHNRHAGLFSRADRAKMNEYGMDADTYLNNVLEHDKD